jgi:transposase
MAMGKRRQQQPSMWVHVTDLPMGAGHPFYRRLNAELESAGFDAFVERLCKPFYAASMGRPSLAPGRYFRLLLVGFFEGLDSERGVAWRAADSLGIRSFLGLAMDEQGPDHSTISRTRRLLDVETHNAVFTWIQERLALAGLLKGKTIAIDGTTLEANAAMRSIVRRDTGESYETYLKKLAKSSGIKTPTREALARLDRRRKNKGSNKEWQSPSDPDAKITKMKDGRTHLAHKAEHAVDVATGAIVAITIQGADQGDTNTIEETLSTAEKQLDALESNPEVADHLHPDGLQEMVGDKGYHSDRVLTQLDERGLRSYISEPERGRRRWDKDDSAQAVVYANRRRIKGARGRRLARSRGEMVERPFAHLFETGGMRRTFLRGHPNILKRILIHAGGFNLALLMRELVGFGKPRSLQGVLPSVLAHLIRALSALRAELATPGRPPQPQQLHAA